MTVKTRAVLNTEADDNLPDNAVRSITPEKVRTRFKDLADSALLSEDIVDLTAHLLDTANPHSVTKAQVGLTSADDTSDANKPISIAAQAALDLKAPLASPALTGAPTVPTPGPAEDSTIIPNTEWVRDHTSSVIDGLNPKNPVRVLVSTGTLATDFENGDTADGIVLATGDAILYQKLVGSSTSDPDPINGIYVVQASGAAVRRTDADTGAEIKNAITTVLEGTWVGSQWAADSTIPNVGVDDITFILRQAAGSAVAFNSEAEAKAGANNTKATTALRMGQATTLAALSLIELRAYDTSIVTRAFLNSGYRSGFFNWDGADLSATLMVAVAASSSVTIATDTITFAAAHALQTGRPVMASTTADLNNNTIYYAIVTPGNFVDLKLATSWANAMAGTAINLTVTTAVTIRLHRDPLQGIYVVKTGAALDGAAGAWTRAMPTGEIDPAMFGALPGATAGYAEQIQAAFQYARHGYAFQSGGVLTGAFANQVSFGGRMYTAERSINMTALRQAGFVIRNGVLLSTAAGEIAFDWLNANEPLMINFQVVGDATASPSVGGLIGRVKHSAGTYPFPSAGGVRLMCSRFTGSFTKTAFINLSSEVFSTDASCKFENRARARLKSCTTFLVTGNYQGIEDHIVSLTSLYQALPDATDNLQIGTCTQIGLERCDIRRPAFWTVALAGISKAATAIVSFTAGDVTASDIQTNDKVYISTVTGTFELPTGNYTLKNVNAGADTAELWNEGASAGINTSAYVGAFAAATMHNDTGPALVLAGSPEQVTTEGGYVLDYTDYSTVLDLSEGDARRITLTHNGEFANGYFLRIIGGAARSVEELVVRPYGSGYRKGIVHNPGTGGLITLDGLEMGDAKDQSPAADARLFANPSNLSIKNGDISISKSTLLGTTDMLTISQLNHFDGSVYDEEAQRAYDFPTSRGTVTWNPASIPDGSLSAGQNVTVSGVIPGDACFAAFDGTNGHLLILRAFCVIAGTITVVAHNESGAAVDAVSGTLRAWSLPRTIW